MIQSLAVREGKRAELQYGAGMEGMCTYARERVNEASPEKCERPESGVCLEVRQTEFAASDECRRGAFASGLRELSKAFPRLMINRALLSDGTPNCRKIREIGIQSSVLRYIPPTLLYPP
jgi:hypothetical protein